MAYGRRIPHRAYNLHVNIGLQHCLALLVPSLGTSYTCSVGVYRLLQTLLLFDDTKESCFSCAA